MAGVLGCGGTAAAAETYHGFPVVKVYVDGKEIESDVPAIIVDGRTLVPLRFIGEALGVTVTWEQVVAAGTYTARLTARDPATGEVAGQAAAEITIAAEAPPETPPAQPGESGQRAGEGKAALAAVVLAAGRDQRVSLLDGELQLDIPAGALPEGARIYVNEVRYLRGGLPEGAALASRVWEISSSQQLGQPVTVCFKVQDLTREPDPRVFQVFRQDRGGAWVRLGGRLDRGTGAVVIQLTSFSRYAVFGVYRSFADVRGHWAEAQIELLAARGVVEGVTADLFMPDWQATRAEIAALLVRLIGAPPVVPEKPTFTDVGPCAWYYGAVEAAAKSGVVMGFDDGSFRPDEPITREQMAALAVRLAGIKQDSWELAFEDRDEISDWAREEVAAASASGLMIGIPGNRFVPRGQLTRAEAAAVAVRLAERLGLYEIPAQSDAHSTSMSRPRSPS